MKSPLTLTRLNMIAILFFIALFYFVRFFRFGETFHYYYDQPLFSLYALEISRSHHIPLIGPPISFTIEGRQIFQGGIIYLVQLFFLLVGGFDPLRSTAAFIIFAGLVIIPLWFGVARLAGDKAAHLVTLLYALFPPFVTGTLELTNPYYQLALMPLLIYAISWDHEKRSAVSTFFVGLTAGFLLQFHYQFVLVLAGLTLYYSFSFKSWKRWLAFIVGTAVGFAPLLLFEFRNNFYNIRTIFFFIQHHAELTSQFVSRFPIQYFLSPLLALIVLLAVIFKKWISLSLVAASAVLLLTLSVDRFVLHPTQGGILTNWSYKDELTVASLIKENHPDRFNIAAWYDTKAITQKYFLARDNITLDPENYTSEPNLFIIYPNDQWVHDSAYELNTFVPSHIVQSWKINNTYYLYLAARD
jgi:hypothetical protein